MIREFFTLAKPVLSFVAFFSSFLLSVWGKNLYNISTQDYEKLVLGFLNSSGMYLSFINLLFSLTERKERFKFPFFALIFFAFLILLFQKEDFLYFILPYLKRFRVVLTLCLLFISFLYFTSPYIEKYFLPVSFAFLIGMNEINFPWFSDELKILMFFPFLVLIFFGNTKEEELSILFFLAFLFMIGRDVITFAGIISIFLRSLIFFNGKIKYLIPLFISPIFLVVGYFSFLNFQRGIPFFEPFNFLAKIKLLLLSLLALYIFVLIYDFILFFFRRSIIPQKLKISKTEILN
ncbi:hypothetical protein HRbin19_00223 [bacterium HR19]|nr:hypothetical protein HRbin19_00223 [bacterium HR19]